MRQFFCYFFILLTLVKDIFSIGNNWRI